MKVTVIGGQGFIGTEVCRELAEAGYSVTVPEKNSPLLFSSDLGVVIYCAGHGDCAKNSLKVLDSNTTLLATLLEKAQFSRMIYLSSTRVYMDRETASEEDDLQISFKDPRRLFNLTKIVSEELCQKSGRDIICLRPSNIYGPAINSPLFLPMIVKNALLKRKVDMFVPPEYAKDYLSVKDLSAVIVHFVRSGWTGFDIYNVASGVNVEAKLIADVLQRETGCEVQWHPGFSGEKFPVTSIQKLQKTMPFSPSHLATDLKDMVQDFAKILGIVVKEKK